MSGLRLLVTFVVAGLLCSCEEPAPEASTRGPGAFVVVDVSGGPEASSYPVEFLDGLPAEIDQPEYKTDKLVFKWIEPGTFEMGQAGFSTPVHAVELSRGFYVSLREITQAQWENVMGRHEFHFADHPSHPAESISWDEVRGAAEGRDGPTPGGVGPASFLGKLTARTPASLSFDLPTEAQWEYACRAGTTTQWSFGDDSDAVDDHLWSDDNSDESSQEVGTLAPNPWGLYDVHGNVAEWCLDRFGSYSRDAQTDPQGPATGWHRVWRGGAWDVSSYLTQSALRSGGFPNRGYSGVGFRPVCAFTP